MKDLKIRGFVYFQNLKLILYLIQVYQIDPFREGSQMAAYAAPHFYATSDKSEQTVFLNILNNPIIFISSSMYAFRNLTILGSERITPKLSAMK